MLYKVIKYIEFTQNTQILKTAVSAVTSEITKRAQTTNHSIALFGPFNNRGAGGGHICPKAISFFPELLEGVT